MGSGVSARLKGGKCKPDPNAYSLYREWQIGSILKQVNSYFDALKRRAGVGDTPALNHRLDSGIATTWM